jgi:hypothetical protein
MNRAVHKENSGTAMRCGVRIRCHRLLVLSVVNAVLVPVTCASDSLSVSEPTGRLHVPTSWEELFDDRKAIPTWELAEKLEAHQHLITADNIKPETAEKLAEYYDFLWTELKLVEYLDYNTGRLSRKAEDERDPEGAPARALERAEEARKRRDLMVRCATLSRWYRSLHKDHLEDKDVEHLYLVHVYLHGPDNVPLAGMAKELEDGRYVSSKCLAVLREFYRDPVMAHAKTEEFHQFLYKSTVGNRLPNHDG